MNHIKVISLVILLFSSFPIYAGESIKSLFGLVPGNESPIINGNDQAPFNLDRIPVKSRKLSAVFPDVQMFALKESNIIFGIGGRRAYESLPGCEKDRKLALSILKEIFPEKYNGDNSDLQYLTVDKEIALGIYCSEYIGNPYPVLQMKIEHMKSHDIFYEQLKKVR